MQNIIEKHNWSSVIHITQIFVRLWHYGYIEYDEYYLDHDYLDHGNIMVGYLDIGIKGNVYGNSSTTTPIKVSVLSLVSMPFPL